MKLLHYTSMLIISNHNNENVDIVIRKENAVHVINC